MAKLDDIIHGMLIGVTDGGYGLREAAENCSKANTNSDYRMHVRTGVRRSRLSSSGND